MRLINADCLRVLPFRTFDCIFADPPDNIGLGYHGTQDSLPTGDYVELLEKWLRAFIYSADTVWFSFNAKWTFKVGTIIDKLLSQYVGLEAKACQQVFTFGQHNRYDFGNNHRPLYRLCWPTAHKYPDAVRVPSWRQLNGDKRADPRGRIPGDVFDMPRVTGNSRQRRAWHPTQLNEDLVERCIKFSTPVGGTVCDPFAGTGTTLRVCQRINRECTLIEIDPYYCEKIAEEHGITAESQ